MLPSSPLLSPRPTPPPPPPVIVMVFVCLTLLLCVCVCCSPAFSALPLSGRVRGGGHPLEPRRFLGQRRGVGFGGEQDGHHRRAQRGVRPAQGRRQQLCQQGARRRGRGSRGRLVLGLRCIRGPLFCGFLSCCRFTGCAVFVVVHVACGSGRGRESSDYSGPHDARLRSAMCAVCSPFRSVDLSTTLLSPPPPPSRRTQSCTRRNRDVRNVSMFPVVSAGHSPCGPLGLLEGQAGGPLRVLRATLRRGGVVPRGRLPRQEQR